MKENMFYGANSFVFQRAEELRNRMTPSEEVLWKSIHINEWKLKFRRQHPMANYVLDFYCNECKLAIELDGNFHSQVETREYDDSRTALLNENGVTVLRFWNTEILNETNKVLQKISEYLY